MLANPYYVGVVTYMGASYPGNHEPLITSELFARVQAVLAAHNHAGERQHIHNHYLKGSIFCAKCGQRLAISNPRSHTGVHYNYFYCLGRQRDPESCSQSVVSVNRVERLVENHWATIVLPDEQLNVVRDSLRKALSTSRARAEVEERTLSTRI